MATHHHPKELSAGVGPAAGMFFDVFLCCWGYIDHFWELLCLFGTAFCFPTIEMAMTWAVWPCEMASNPRLTRWRAPTAQQFPWHRVAWCRVCERKKSVLTSPSLNRTVTAGAGSTAWKATFMNHLKTIEETTPSQCSWTARFLDTKASWSFFLFNCSVGNLSQKLKPERGALSTKGQWTKSSYGQREKPIKNLFVGWRNLVISCFCFFIFCWKNFWESANPTLEIALTSVAQTAFIGPWEPRALIEEIATRSSLAGVVHDKVVMGSRGDRAGVKEEAA